MPHGHSAISELRVEHFSATPIAFEVLDGLGEQLLTEGAPMAKPAA